MALQKFGDAEKAEVFQGEEARVVNEHLAKTGKTVSEFDENEMASLQASLDAVRQEEQPAAEEVQEEKLPRNTEQKKSK